MIERVESLTAQETLRLINRAYDDTLNDDPLLRQHASEFYKAWLAHKGGSITSMLWALNNDALTYRLHLISLLIDFRLFGPP